MNGTMACSDLGVVGSSRELVVGTAPNGCLGRSSVVGHRDGLWAVETVSAHGVYKEYPLPRLTSLLSLGAELLDGPWGCRHPAPGEVIAWGSLDSHHYQGMKGILKDHVVQPTHFINFYFIVFFFHYHVVPCAPPPRNHLF